MQPHTLPLFTIVSVYLAFGSILVAIVVGFLRGSSERRREYDHE